MWIIVAIFVFVIFNIYMYHRVKDNINKDATKRAKRKFFE
jgi:hypothetical protein